MRASTNPILLICLIGLYLVSSGVIEINLLRINDNTKSQTSNSNSYGSSNSNAKKYGLDMTFEEYKA